MKNSLIILSLCLTSSFVGATQTRKVSKEGVGSFKFFLGQAAYAVDGFSDAIYKYREDPDPKKTFLKELPKQYLSNFENDFPERFELLKNDIGMYQKGWKNTVIAFDADRYNHFVKGYADILSKDLPPCMSIMKRELEKLDQEASLDYSKEDKTQLIQCRTNISALTKELVGWFPEEQVDNHPKHLPPITFHGGKREDLMPDIEYSAKNGGFPENIWNQFVMSGPSDFSLPSYRKGFYVTQSYILGAKYTDRYTENGDWPWIAIVEVAPDCQETGFDERVEKSLNTGSPLRAWVDSKLPTEKFETDADFMKRCSRETMRVEGLDYSFVLGRGYMEDPKKAKIECYDLFDEYMKFKNARVAMDTVETESWYFRDRSCIKAIRGTADDQIDLMMEKDSPFWRFEEFDEYGQEGLKSVFLQSLNGANLDSNKLDILIQRQNEAFERINRDSEGHDADLVSAFQWFSSKAKACVEKGGVELLREQLQPALEKPRTFEDKWPKLDCK